MERPDRTMRLMLDGTATSSTRFAEAPLIVFVCGSVRYPPAAPTRADHLVGAVPGSPDT